MPSSRCIDRNLFVDVLAILFGIGAWIGITGIYLQLPIIIETAPEGWKLPSYMVVIVQSGNIASLTYLLYDKYSSVRISDAYLIYVTLSIGCLAAFLSAFFYGNTIEINGEQRSVPLLVFTCMFAIVGCVSSVLFMPFMGRFRGIYLTTYMFGQGLNGFVSSIVSLIQGVGTQDCLANNSTEKVTAELVPKPLFEPKIYFLFVFGALVLSLLAFVLLNNLKICHREHYDKAPIENNNSKCEQTKVNRSSYENIPDEVQTMPTVHYSYLLMVIGVISFLGYGIFPGLQSYSCLPYGAFSYHLAVTLSAIVNPLSCLVAMYFPHSSMRSITFQILAATLASCYIFYTAIKSPTPPLATSIFGDILIVLAWTVFQAITTFTKLSILMMLSYQGGKSLVSVGAVIQFSACIGAIIIFVVVNYTKIFIPYNPCRD